jgi:hypothetical protein
VPARPPDEPVVRCVIADQAAAALALSFFLVVPLFEIGNGFERCLEERFGKDYDYARYGRRTAYPRNVGERWRRVLMTPIEFDADLRREGYQVMNTSLAPNQLNLTTPTNSMPGLWSWRAKLQSPAMVRRGCIILVTTG